MTTRPAFAPILVVGLCALALAGCAPQGSPSPSPSVASPSDSPSASASPSPSSEPDTPGDFSAECDAVLSPETIYDFNANLAIDVEFSPAAGSTAEQLGELGGVVCAWVNLSSGTHVVVAIAEPRASDAAQIEADAAATMAATSIYDLPGYFGARAGAGEAVVVSGQGVIVVASEEFIEAADATPLVDAAIASYKAG